MTDQPRDAGVRRHKGDPCIYCHLPHDDVPVGPCVWDGKRPCPPHAFPNFGRDNCIDCGIHPTEIGR